MNKLENYLQEVCRSMGGPRSLRDHVRQELREHLMDAASQHQAAGLSEQEALEKALDEFGKPDVVRNELEATHGHRMMLSLVIDKAMEWKEKTMKAKWLWASWTYLMVLGIIVLEILFCFFSVIYLLPKMKKLRHDGYLIADDQTQSIMQWMFHFLEGVADHFQYWLAWVLGAVAVWGLFEWRVRSENKPFMRTSFLGTIALALLLVVIVMSASMALPFLMSMPALGKMTRPWASDHFQAIDRSLTAMQAHARKADRPELEVKLKDISMRLHSLAEGPTFNSWRAWDQSVGDEMQQALLATKDAVRYARENLWNKDDSILLPAVERINKAFEPLRKAIKRSDEPVQR